VNKNISLLAAFFGLIAMATFACAELFYFAAPLLLLDGHGYLQTFSPAQLDTLALFSLKLYGYGGAIFMAFYGIACVFRGYLIYQSGYLPRVLGALLIIAGGGFIIHNFLLVLAPGYASNFLLMPMALAGLSLELWVLVKGIGIPQWEMRASQESADTSA
jgi:hypothetical protein